MRKTIEVAKKILGYIWNEVKVPIMLIILFYFAGFGFYQGFMNSKLVQFVKGERVIVITTLDLDTGKIEEED